MKKRWTLILVLIGFALVGKPQTNYKVIAYYGGKMPVELIPAEKLDVINFAFAEIDPQTGRLMISDSARDTVIFKQLVELKNRNPKLKVLISVGGWGRSKWFSNVANGAENRKVFAESCVAFLRNYQFDGVDVDWEFPVNGGLPENIYRKKDKRNYTLLLKDLRTALDRDGQYLLTAAVTASPDYVKNIEPEEMARYLDWFNVMTYDFHGQNEQGVDRYTNFNAPLDAVHNDPVKKPYNRLLNVKAAVQYYLKKGIPSFKIIPGAPFYAKGYAHVPPENHGLFQKYKGVPVINGENKPYFTFYELDHDYVNKNGYVRYWCNEAQVPWLYHSKKRIFISYDDEQSVKAKAEYVRNNHLGGLMFWELSQDKEGKLLKVIVETLKKN